LAMSEVISKRLNRQVSVIAWLLLSHGINCNDI
jgi:hypothetical protein